MATNLRDVAERAGVSISAVSRVLSDAPSARVRPETRERIHRAAQELGYRPNHAGRALKLARSNVIALIVPDLTNAIFTELMQGVEEAAIAQDYVILLGRSEGMQPGGEMIDRLIGEGRVDGVLVQLDESLPPDDIEPLLESSAPVVFINSFHDGIHSSVSLPNEQAAAVATEHLLGLGHRRIGYVGGSRTISTSIDREHGFRRTLAGAGLPVDETMMTSLGYTAEQGRRALRDIWVQEEHPTAVVVANLNAAIGVLAEARTLGVGIPEDLSVVAVLDAWTAENTWPPLTTVRMPLRELGRTAVELLMTRLVGGERGDMTISSPRPSLIVRESTAPCDG